MDAASRSSTVSADHRELPNLELRNAIAAADSLLLYADVLSDDVGQAFLALLRAIVENIDVRTVRSHAASLFRLLVSAVEPGRIQPGDAWQGHLARRILEDDNPYTRAAGGMPFDRIPAGLQRAARHDLRLLGRVSAIDGARLGLRVNAVSGEVIWTDLRDLGSTGPTHDLTTSLLITKAGDWEDLVADLAAHHRRAGVGRFAAHWAFRWANHRLVPIARPDPITFDDLIGYDDQRHTVRRNTEHFLDGLPANNLLLYGERGTGKSSTVKALLHAYGDRRLRLVEVAKSSLGEYAEIIGELAGRPERFIIFVDDLSFDENETGYTDLKAILEGSLEVRPPNVLLYATSNRRHLILERFSDRVAPDDEIHAQDTVQEKLSLADRFGVTVVYLSPNQDQYLAIVAGLARQRGLSLDDGPLRRRALQWAAWNNGRSGRTARQFIDDLTAEVGEVDEQPK